MAKDKLGLEWNVNSDEPLYNAMIWALSIGIVIVIATLILTKPAPESFTELYFNNHTTLPEYVTLNKTYPYSFSITNLENMNKTYNYTISEEYYIMDYSCEAPELWLTNTTETNDPALYIKDNKYAVGFDYEFKNGDKISVALVTPDNKDIYRIYISDDNIIFDGKKYNMTLSQGTHRFKMSVDESYIRITLDTYKFSYTTPKAYTHGYLNFQTHDTYAEFSNVYIEKSLKYNVYVRLADAVYKEQDILNATGKYYTDTPINLTSYTVKTSFRLNAVSLELRNNTMITYDKGILNITFNNVTEKFAVDEQSTNDITTKVSNESIKIYYNNEYITSIPNTEVAIMPQIIYTNATINNFYIKSDEAPITINYKLPQTKEVSSQLLTLNSLKYMSEKQDYEPTFTNITAGLNDTTEIKQFIEQEKVYTDDYRITVTYVDRKGTFNIAMADLDKNIYSLTIGNGTARLTYRNDTLQTKDVNVTILNTNKVYIDVKNNTLAVYLNSKRIFYQTAQTTNGILLFDYDSITLTNAQLQDRNTGKTTIYKKQQSECEPILLNKYIYNDEVSIQDKYITTIKENAIFTESFDIAKIQVTLDNGQEIHYWVKQI
ncbi:MAG: hypothetical protein ACP5OA_07775 [Candidatus Woesearchaeota archaeon]